MSKITPLFTGHIKAQRPPHNGREDRFHTPKPQHRSQCPNDWRWFTALAMDQGEECLFVNQRCRTFNEVHQKLEKDYPGIQILEVRQQPALINVGTADLWWDREIPHTEASAVPSVMEYGSRSLEAWIALLVDCLA